MALFWYDVKATSTPWGVAVLSMPLAALHLREAMTHIGGKHQLPCVGGFFGTLGRHIHIDPACQRTALRSMNKDNPGVSRLPL